MARTASITENMYGRTTNIRNTPERKAVASSTVRTRQDIAVRGDGLVRSNVNPSGTVRNTAISSVNTPTQDLVDIPTGVQTESVNWLLPLVVLGGFFAASRFKKKNKKPIAKKVKL